MRFELVARTHVGLKRKANEDNLLLLPDAGLFLVADGMGGHEGGQLASQAVVEAVQRLSIAALKPTTDEVVATLAEVNGDLRALAREKGLNVIGSTVAGLLFDDEMRFDAFWAGDSRLYRLRDRSFERLSRDHSLVQELVDAGLLDEEKAQDHPNGNMITRAVGAADELRVEAAAGEAREGDLFLLATDGVTRVVGDEELAAALLQPVPLSEIADGLVWTVLRRGAPDNLTLVLVRVSGEV